MGRSEAVRWQPAGCATPASCQIGNMRKPKVSLGVMGRCLGARFTPNTSPVVNNCIIQDSCGIQNVGRRLLPRITTAIRISIHENKQRAGVALLIIAWVSLVRAKNSLTGIFVAAACQDRRPHKLTGISTLYYPVFLQAFVSDCSSCLIYYIPYCSY